MLEVTTKWEAQSLACHDVPIGSINRSIVSITQITLIIHYHKTIIQEFDCYDKEPWEPISSYIMSAVIIKLHFGV